MNKSILISTKENQCPEMHHEYELEGDESSSIEYLPSDFLPSSERSFSSLERSLIQGLGRWAMPSTVNSSDKNDFNEGRCYEEMGIAKAKCGNTTEALCFFDLALKAKRQCSDNDADLIYTLLNRARAFGKKDLIRSCSEYKEVIKMKEKTRPAACVQHASRQQEDLFLAKVLVELGQVQYQRGDFTSAIRNFNAALDIRVGCLGTQHDDVAYIWYLIGKMYHIKRDYKEAMVAYRNSHKIYSLEGRKKKNHAIIQVIQRLVSDKTMLADVSKRHWRDNSTV